MELCISQITCLPCSFAEDIAHAAATGWTAVEVWLTKLEQHLETHTIAATHRYIADYGVRLVAAAGQGGLFTDDERARQEHRTHFRRRLELCQAFGIPVMVVAADVPPHWSAEQFPRLLDLLQSAAEWAEAFGVRLGLEFQAGSPLCASLATACSIVQTCRRASLGICLDSFHFFKGSSKTEDLDLIRPGDVVHVQLSDICTVLREVWTDADRILPGDGLLPLRSLVQKLRQSGYDSVFSVELMNPSLWQSPPQQVMELSRMALARLVEP